MKDDIFLKHKDNPISLEARENPRCATPFIDSLRFKSTPDLIVDPVPAYLRREKIVKKRYG